MFSAITKAFREALFNLRTNFFQTILSVLGIIIGVGALVTMLSLIDGMEAMAKKRIADRSSLENINISSNQKTRIDGVYADRDSVARLNVSLVQEMLNDIPYPATGQLFSRRQLTRKNPRTDSLLGIQAMAVSWPLLDTSHLSLTAGRLFDLSDQSEARGVGLVSEKLARRLAGEDEPLVNAIGTHLAMPEGDIEIIGVVKIQEATDQTLIYPITWLSERATTPLVPRLVLAVASVEEVRKVNEFSKQWLEERFAGVEDPFTIESQDYWLEELEKGFLAFRLIMGLIVGVAVVVGGVGVMNVLLMSISSRTTEIGVRKAIGANRLHIIGQFLSESVAVSVIGSVFGVVLGVLVALAAGPILTQFIPEVEFRAVFTVRTLLTVGVIAILVGIIFGTYPARRAAGLDPVEAIRRT